MKNSYFLKNTVPYTCALFLKAFFMVSSIIPHQLNESASTLYSEFFWTKQKFVIYIERFYLNTIEQLFLFVEQLDQFEVCLPYSRLLAGISILAVFQNLRWNSNKTSLSSIIRCDLKIHRVIILKARLNLVCKIYL